VVVRVVDPAQARMMAGFVLWHVIGHQRRFATYRAQQHERVWKRLPQRTPHQEPIALLGRGAIGARVAPISRRSAFR
jgi:glyoxylate/hydroxypyruvate reductase A